MRVQRVFESKRLEHYLGTSMSENLALLIFSLHVLFAAFLLTVKNGKRLSNQLLAFFLFITAVDISNFVFQSFYSEHLNLNMIRANVAALLAPTLYLYIKSVVIEDFKLKFQYLYHLLPFVAISVLFMPRFHWVDETAKMAFFSHQQPMIEMVIAPIFMHLQLAAYLFAIFLTLRRYNLAVTNTHSDLSQLNKDWLMAFTGLFFIEFVLVTIRNIVKFTTLEHNLNWLTPVMLLSALGFIGWILWQALHKPEIFSGIRAIEFNKIPALTNNKTHRIDQYQAEKISHTLLQHMTKHKTYLQSGITLQALATKLNVDAQDLSWVLNRYLGTHFFDYINKLRIDESVRRLTDVNNDKTILDIAYNVGFNSKSSFNTAFKKHTGKTPSSFRSLSTR